MARNPHQLSRAEMVEIINRGERVIAGGKVIESLDQIPSDIDMAAGDPETQQRLLEEIDKHGEELSRKREALVRAIQTTAAQSKPEETKDQPGGEESKPAQSVAGPGSAPTSPPAGSAEVKPPFDPKPGAPPAGVSAVHPPDDDDDDIDDDDEDDEEKKKPPGGGHHGPERGAGGKFQPGHPKK